VVSNRIRWDEPGMNKLKWDVIFDPPPEAEKQFRKVLEPYCLTSMQTEILLGRFYEKKTWSELAISLRLPSPQSVIRECQHILKMLRQRGFKL